jgi:hypothetical protein
MFFRTADGIIHRSFSLNSLTPHSTDLLEKLTGLQLVKKFPTFYTFL